MPIRVRGAALPALLIAGCAAQPEVPSTPGWAVFSLAEIGAGASEQRWREFFRTASLATGLYRLPAGAQDAQRPHAQDEVYYVIAGRAQFRADGVAVAVAPGSVIFVAAGKAHRFEAIAEDLELLVLFAGG